MWNCFLGYKDVCYCLCQGCVKWKASARTEAISLFGGWHWDGTKVGWASRGAIHPGECEQWHDMEEVMASGAFWRVLGSWDCTEGSPCFKDNPELGRSMGVQLALSSAGRSDAEEGFCCHSWLNCVSVFSSWEKLDCGKLQMFQDISVHLFLYQTSH